MKSPIPSLLIIATSLASLSSCVTTPTAMQMREAKSMLKQSSKKAEQGDFTAASTAAAAIGRRVRQGVELAPVAETKSGKKVDLKPMLIAWESGPYQDLQKALKSNDAKSSSEAFIKFRGQCTNCHAAIGRPGIRVN